MRKSDANLYAAIAQAAYNYQCNEANFRITAKFENKGTDTQGLFGEAYGNTYVIAFRGSEETGVSDWITDLKFIQQLYPFAPKEAPKMEVHYGFTEAYASVRDAVLKAAKDTPHKKVVCVGHSLGGALATLAAMDIRLNVPGKEVSCYTFGSPKVGDANFAAHYNQCVPQTTRVVNASDLVPNIPPFGYEHVGQLLHIGQASTMVGSIIESISGTIEDHFPYKYIQAVRDYLDWDDD